jgi:hypothetical protein
MVLCLGEPLALWDGAGHWGTTEEGSECCSDRGNGGGQGPVRLPSEISFLWRGPSRSRRTGRFRGGREETETSPGPGRRLAWRVAQGLQGLLDRA